MASLSPAGLAQEATKDSPDPWRLYPFHAVLNRHLVRACSPGAHWKHRRLIITCPPQHGKSRICSEFLPPWFLGLYPHRRVILASYEASFARRWGRKARDVIENHGYPLWGLRVRQDSRAMNEWNLLGHDGGMETAGVEGSITGRTGGLMILDDYLKNFKDAFSKQKRDDQWDWWHSTFANRITKDGIVIVVATRWHPDDLIGRLLKEEGDDWTVVRMPAIAEEDEDWGIWKRTKGEPLCPEIKPISFLNRIRDRSPEYWWATQYQCRPYVRQGGKFNPEKLEVVNEMPKRVVGVRVWDPAGSEKKDAKESAGARISKAEDGLYYIEHVESGKWEPFNRDNRIKAVAEMDGKNLKVLIEQEPGSGGKAQVQHIQALLDGWATEPVQTRDGDKELRADPFASAVNAGRVKMVDDHGAGWNAKVIEQMLSFPRGLIDIIDALSHGYNYIAGRSGAIGIDV